MMIGVSGVGPKAALSILSVAPPDRLALSIITGDEKTLTQAPGIGKKIAQPHRSGTSGQNEQGAA